MSDHSDPFAIARARHALQSSGLPFDGPLERASSTRNEVFMSDEYAIRINRHPNQRLRREAKLCARLPKAPWAPTVVSHGGDIGADFLIVERRPGIPLSRAWPTMTVDQRRRASEQLGAALSELHQVQTPADLPRLEIATHLIDPRCVSPLVPLLVALDALRRDIRVDKGLIRTAEQLVMDTGSSLDDYSQRRLVHGDLTFENVLWDGTGISGLLDFEWCRGGSPDLDLDVLLRFCAFPYAHVAEDYEALTRPEDYRDVPGWLADHMPESFAHPRLAERLMLYSLAFDVQDLTQSLDAARDQRGPLHPMNRLRSLLSTGGHLTTMLASVGVHV